MSVFSRILPALICVFLLFLSVGLFAQSKSKIAVMPIKDNSGEFTREILTSASTYLRSGLAEHDDYVVIDESRQKKKLEQLIDKKKRESYKECYDKECQIPLGKALAADTVAQSTISKLGKCIISIEFVDLAKEASVKGAQTKFQCTPTGLSKAIDRSVATLTGERESAERLDDSSPESGSKKTAGNLGRQSVVEFNSSPSASVFVDGSLVCEKTPCERVIPAGSHTVKMTAENFHTKTSEVTIKPMANPVIEWDLKLKATPYPAIDAGGDSNCGIMEKGQTIRCWGSPGIIKTVTVQDTEFDKLEVDADVLCATTKDHRLRCWNLLDESKKPMLKSKGRYEDVSITDPENICAVRSDSAVVCWVNEKRYFLCESTNESSPKLCRSREKADLVKLSTVRSAGPDRYCGLSLRTSQIKCFQAQPAKWRAQNTLFTDPPKQRFEQFVLGLGFGCGLNKDGQVDCWGWQPDAVRDLNFRTITAGSEHICGITGQQNIACVRKNSEDKPDVLSGQFKEVTAAGRHTCALSAEGKLFCWGQSDSDQMAVPEDLLLIDSSKTVQPDEGAENLGVQSFVEFKSTPSAMVSLNGRLVCESTPCERLVPKGTYTAVMTTENFQTKKKTIKLGPDRGAVVNWRLKLKDSSYPTLSSQLQITCGTSIDGTRIHCWDTNSQVSKSYEGQTFIDLDVGGDYLCAIDESSDLLCWNFEESKPFLHRRNYDFVSVSVGAKDEKCAMTDGGSAHCWKGEVYYTLCSDEKGNIEKCKGDNVHGSAKQAELKSLSLGEDGGCGLLKDGKVGCWGETDVSAFPIHQNVHKFATFGSGFGCGIGSDSTVSCWSKNGKAHVQPPKSKFITISAGKKHVCGLTKARRVECWGPDTKWRDVSPKGRYKTVSSGARHTCAISLAGSVRCWGKNLYGISQNILFK